jgi:hypothetical protein
MKRIAIITGIFLLLFTSHAKRIHAQEARATNYAQSLIDHALARHPEVATLAMHVTPPKTPDNVIIASNFGRLGKKADDDDLNVIKTGQTKAEVGRNGDRFSIELPLRDVSGDTVGVLAVAFPYKQGKAGNDKAQFIRQAEQVRDELGRRITNAGNLVEPFPYSATPTNTYAQKLVDETIARHPDLQILALHITPPNSTENIILASSIGRIGKKGDEDDLDVMKSGKPLLEVHISGKRFEVELQLHDRNGKTIGAISTVFPYKAGDDKSQFQKRGEAIRAEIEKKIPSAAKLMEPTR